MMKQILPIFSVTTALWLLLRTFRRTKKSKSIPHEASPSQNSTPDSGTARRDFDVFLNFRGPDSRHTVADILYNTLTDAGIHVFRDDEEIRRGKVIKGELEGAITNSRFYVPILSKDYASSKWCLRELAKMIDCWERSSDQAKKVILPIFYDVSVDDVKLRSHVYTSALQKHKKELDEAVVKTWEEALEKVARIKGWNLQDHGLSELANLIKHMVLSDINANETAPCVPDRLVGIHDKMKDILQLLQDGTPDVRFIVIHGMGGIGKTTLANVVYNKISSRFQGSCILKDVRRSSSNNGIVKLQEKLLLDTLHLQSIDISDIDDGISIISKRLRNRKVLIVLDDVDKREHLKNLAAKSSWFGPMSRIIITTRNTGFLPTTDDKDYLFYGVKEMDRNLALQLFCRHAFENEHPLPEYHDISMEIVATTGGLPLALQVIGSSLYNGDMETWEFTLNKLKDAPYEDVHETLMISYQALVPEQQQIFLDIACFFNGEKKVDPIYFWEACKLYPKSVINVLVRRSLIKVNEHDELWMHDQLRYLGRAIAQPETQDSKNQIRAKPSRLWSPEVALDVVQKKEVAESIVALDLGILDDRYCFGPEEFVTAKNLKFLQLQRGNFKGDFKNAFQQLRWLSWSDCPLEIKAMNLSFTNLVVIKLSGWHITDDWTGWSTITAAKQLKVMHLKHCCLTKTPNFSVFLGLKRLVLKYCGRLKEIDWSINKLKHLDYLEISFDGKYRIHQASHLLPASIGGLKSLTMLKLANTGIIDLDHYHSIGELTSLVTLLIQGGITRLPDSIGNLTQLKILRITQAPINCLPDSIGRLESLNELDLRRSSITQLPETIGDLKCLKILNLGGTGIEKLPKALVELENLEELHASECERMDDELPEEIGRLSRLRILDLGWSKITGLPPKLPTSLTDLKLHFVLPKVPALPDLSYMTNLVSLVLRACTNDDNSHGVLQLQVETTGIEWITRLPKLKKLKLYWKDLIFAPTDLSPLHQLQKLGMACFDPRSLACLPSSLEFLYLDDLMSPINWQVLSCLNNLSTLRLERPRLKEINIDSPVDVHSLGLLSFKSLERLSGLSYLTELRMLDIDHCPCLIDIHGLGELEFLRSIRMVRCHSIKKLPDLTRLKKLEILIIGECESLESLPDISVEAPCSLLLRACRHLRDYNGPYWNYHRT